MVRAELGRGGAGHLPRVRDAGEAVSCLRVPYAHVPCQATAHQQHAIAGQTLDVLWERGVDMGTGGGTARPPAPPAPPTLTLRCPRCTRGTISVSGGA